MDDYLEKLIERFESFDYCVDSVFYSIFLKDRWKLMVMTVPDLNHYEYAEDPRSKVISLDISIDDNLEFVSWLKLISV